MNVRATAVLVCILVIRLTPAFGAPGSGHLPTAAPADVGMDAARLQRVREAIQHSIADAEIPGAVVLVARHGKVVLREAFGDRAVAPVREKMTVDSIFDLASLTKPVATATAIMLLVEDGRIQLSDTLAKLMPELDRHGKGAITVEQLLRHRSGLIADNPLSDYAEGPDKAWERIADLTLQSKPDEKFTYSDVNYIILGRLVERLGCGLHIFCANRIFEPLGMADTRFRPAPDARLVPTMPGDDGTMLRGVVHDPRAQAMGGVAGHAGLFGTADDLAVLCQTLLDGGVGPNGQRVLSPLSVRAMLDPGDTPAGEKRGLGWDIDTAYSGPRGELFGTQSFGHTGFTGTSLWIDRETDSFVILLTSRLHPDGNGKAPIALRRNVATAVAASITDLNPGAAKAAASTTVHQRPNILVLIADDHAAYTLGVDGDPHGATPNLDALARSGVYFSRAFCASPVCTASRQAFLTGRYPHANGVTVLSTPLPESAVTMADWLGGQGYATAAIGKMHFNSALSHGFEKRIDRPDWIAWLRANPPPDGAARRPWKPFADPARVWLNAEAAPSGLPSSHEEAGYFTTRAIEYLNEQRDRPFFLVVSYNEPHSPFVFPNDWEKRAAPSNFGSFPISDFDRARQPKIFTSITDEETRGIRSAYYTSLRYVDAQLGRVLEALDQTGLSKNTIVVYWGDNGYLLGQHGRFEKHVLYDEAVRVPLIVRVPGETVRPDRKIAQLVETIDVLPTLADLLGLEAPAEAQGRSFGGLLRGEPGAPVRDAVFSEYLENEEAMIRTERYKLIVGTGKRHRQDGYETYNPTPGPYEHLYDLRDDPTESLDLSGRGDLAQVRDDLRGRLRRVFDQTSDPGQRVGTDMSEREALNKYLVPRDAPPVVPASETK